MLNYGLLWISLSIISNVEVSYIQLVFPFLKVIMLKFGLKSIITHHPVSKPCRILTDFFFIWLSVTFFSVVDCSIQSTYDLHCTLLGHAFINIYIHLTKSWSGEISFAKGLKFRSLRWEHPQGRWALWSELSVPTNWCDLEFGDRRLVCPSWA